MFVVPVTALRIVKARRVTAQVELTVIDTRVHFYITRMFTINCTKLTTLLLVLLLLLLLHQDVRRMGGTSTDVGWPDTSSSNAKP